MTRRDRRGVTAIAIGLLPALLPDVALGFLLQSEAIMRQWLRRIRGAIGIGLTWAVALGLVGGIPRWVLGINTDAPIPLLFGVFGFIAGVTFSGLLVLAEGRRRFDEMSLARFAGWGAAGGLLLSGIWASVASLGLGDILAIAPAFSVACAACASGSLALARRAERRELSDGQENAAAAPLSDARRRAVERRE